MSRVHLENPYISGGFATDTSNSFDEAPLVVDHYGKVSVASHNVYNFPKPCSISDQTDIQTAANAPMNSASLNTAGGATIAKNLILYHGTSNPYFPITSQFENMRCIRGTVSGVSGAILDGAGMTCSVSSTNGYSYTITFNTPFTANPSVSAIVYDPAQLNVSTPTTQASMMVPMLVALSPTSCTLKFWSTDYGSGNLNKWTCTATQRFSVVIVGPGGSIVF